MAKVNGKLQRAASWEIFDIPLRLLCSNKSNPRDSSPVLISMGYGIFHPQLNTDKPTLMSLALSANASMRLAFVDLIERFDPPIASMGNNIKTKELYQHIAVCKEDDGTYDVVYGCRRVLAVAYLSCKFNVADPTIPARIGEWSEQDRCFVSFSENHHRLGQTAIDEARYYLKMQQDNIPFAEIAAQCGTNEQHVRQRIKLNNLPPEIKDKVASGKIGITKATKMANLSPEELQHRQEEMEKKKSRNRMPTLRDLREWYEKDKGIAEEVRKFIATRLLRVRYIPRKRLV